MRKEVIWEFHAIEDLFAVYRQDRQQAVRILRALEQYAHHNRGDIKKLAGGSGEWRLRVGDWRVIFAPRAGDDFIHVFSVRLRRDAYDE